MLLLPTYPSPYIPRIRSSAGRSPPPRPSKKPISHSLGGDPWKKLTDLDPDLVRERLSSLFGKARMLLTEVAAPLVGPREGRTMEKKMEEIGVQEEVFMASELTVERRSPRGPLSLAAVVSIEQFGR